MNKGRARSSSRCRKFSLLRFRSAEHRGAEWRPRTAIAISSRSLSLFGHPANPRASPLSRWDQARLYWPHSGGGSHNPEKARTVASSIHSRRSASHSRPSNEHDSLRYEGSPPNGAENYNTPVMSSYNQTTADSEEEVGAGGIGTGSLTGLAPMAVADVNSIIASPEWNNFFMISSRYSSGPRLCLTLDP